MKLLGSLARSLRDQVRKIGSAFALGGLPGFGRDYVRCEAHDGNKAAWSGPRVSKIVGR